MEAGVKTHFLGFTPKIIISHSHQRVKLKCPILCAFNNQTIPRNFAGQLSTRTNYKCFPSISAVLSGAKDVKVSSSEYEGFSIITSDVNEPGKLKISVEVSGTTTQAMFDKVFNQMVADAQPIPGFRRVKGVWTLPGKTPDIPNHILLEVLGHSKVWKQVIKKVINTTIAEYVEKEGLKVSKDLRVEQSYEDLELDFEAGETFNFTAVLELR